MMKTMRSFSLRLGLPLLVAFIVMLAWLMMTWNEFENFEPVLISDSKRLIMQDMTNLQHEIDRDFSLGQGAEAESAVTIRGGNSQYRSLVVIDDQGKILYSTKFDLKGLPAVSALPDFDLQHFTSLQKQKRPALFVKVDDKIITAYFPLTLERNENEMRALRTGAIFLVYDYGLILSVEKQALWHKSASFAWVLAFAVLALFVLAHYFLYRPIQHLVATAQAIAKGDTSVRSNISGQGELALLSQAFNEMGDQLIERDMQRDRVEKELQESEKLHRSLIETTSVVAWEYDLQIQKFTYMGPQILALTGFPAEQWTDYQFWEDQIYIEDREKSSSFCTAQTMKGKDHSFEYRVVTAEGKIIWVRDEVGIAMEEGRPVALRGYFFDITKLKHTEQALRRSQKMEAIGQLTGGIAHDFNNILSIILGNLELMQHQQVMDDKAQKRFDTIDHAVQRAINLTRQLLSFSRHEVTSEKNTDINQLIESMHGLIAHSLTPEVEVEQHLGSELWMSLMDPGDFEDALVNLAINARDAMGGNGKLTIETQNITLDEAYCELNPAATPGEYVQLVVSDNGEGISFEQQERIFEPFYTTKEQGKGTGLGLSMVFGFVKRTGGTIKVYSEIGIGTSFCIYLPRANEKEQTLKENTVSAKIMQRGQETILAVDDEESLLSLAYETLTNLGYRVLTANNASQAQEVFASEPNIALLFSDVVMPGGMNGFELAEKLVGERPQLKVLLTSGYTEKAIARNGQVRFKTNMLSKPYTLADLAQKVRNLLDESKNDNTAS